MKSHYFLDLYPFSFDKNGYHKLFKTYLPIYGSKFMSISIWCSRLLIILQKSSGYVRPFALQARFLLWSARAF